ncbi:MAG: hypothetical protein CEE40_02430 [Chloroflexi bacterium B3_Chlor]|nr:MAG: hypothetical protein CEE40_02430 [Chloroflexi bacterium B3_Chlor]
MLLVLLLCIFFMASREVTDPDFWWHLRTGQHILETRSIPRQDIFSYALPDQPWITHEWLTEVILYLIYSVSGQEGLILTFAALITGAFGLLYLQCPGRPYLAAFVIILAAITSAVTWGVRPQMFSLFLSSAFLYILHSYERGRTKIIWLMPPLMVLWANLHGTFLLGLVFPSVHIVGATIANLCRGSGEQTLAWRDVRRLLIVTLIAGVAPLANPNGIRLLLYPFGTLGSPAMQAYIMEWFSPDFHQIQFQPLALFILLIVVALGLSRRTPSATGFLFLVGFGYASLRSARHIPFFVLTGTPILAAQLLHIWQRSKWSRRFTPRRRQRATIYLVLNWLLLSLVVFGGAIKVGLTLRGNVAAQRAAFPVEAVDFIVERRITGNMYNLYHWGGYLIWRLYPDHKVFIDGRADVYGDAFIDQYLQVYQLREGWEEPLDAYEVTLVIIDEGSPLSTVLNERPDWERRYADEKAAIFVTHERGGS